MTLFFRLPPDSKSRGSERYDSPRFRAFNFRFQPHSRYAARHICRLRWNAYGALHSYGNAMRPGFLVSQDARGKKRIDERVSPYRRPSSNAPPGNGQHHSVTSITSGNDATIAGAAAPDSEVTPDVGNNPTVQPRQDTACATHGRTGKTGYTDAPVVLPRKRDCAV